jgi:hypothetical protein
VRPRRPERHVMTTAPLHQVLGGEDGVRAAIMVAVAATKQDFEYLLGVPAPGGGRAGGRASSAVSVAVVMVGGIPGAAHTGGQGSVVDQCRKGRRWRTPGESYVSSVVVVRSVSQRDRIRYRTTVPRSRPVISSPVRIRTRLTVRARGPAR